jgi:hypothetical protein
MVIAGNGLSLTGSTLDVNVGNGISTAGDVVAVTYSGSAGDYGISTGVARSDHAHSTLYPPVGRTIATTAPLTGGGDLSANRTLDINSFAGSAKGAVPFSLGGTVNFLRADGSWAAPASAGTVKKYAISVGGSVTIVVNHALGTRDVAVDVYRVASPFDTVECDIERTDNNNVTLRFAVAPAAAEYRCVVLA